MTKPTRLFVWLLAGPLQLLPLAICASGCVGDVGTQQGNVGGDDMPRAPGPGAPSGTMPPVSRDEPAGCVRGQLVSAPSRLYRLTDAQYAASIKNLLGASNVLGINPFSVDKNDARFGSSAAGMGMPELVVDQLVTQSETVAKQLVTAQLKPAATCLNKTPLEAACVQEMLAQVAKTSFRRTALPEELALYRDAVLQALGELGLRAALELGVEAVLTAPASVFRFELGAGTPDSAGRLRLSSSELASQLAFTITDAPPDDKLLRLAAEGGLDTAQGLRSEAARLWSTPAASAVVSRFLRQYFRYHDAPSVFKDAKAYPHHQATALVADTDAFLADAFGQHKNFFDALFLSSTSFASPQTAASYGLKAMQGARQKVTLPPNERFGILTQPAFLTAWSESDHNDPIKRGKLILDTLLCQAIPDIPIGVVPALPDLGPNATVRDRLAMHNQGSCASCHDLMDPLGLTLEGYDHTGRMRAEESGRPVLTTGAVKGMEVADVPLAGAGDLARYLAASPHVHACFVQQALVFLAGRAALTADACAIEDAVAAMKIDGDLVQAFVNLSAADTFVYRKPFALSPR